MRFHPLVLPFTSAVLAAAMLGMPAHAGTSESRSNNPHIATVHATAQTPLEFDDEAGGNADADDPAIWVHPTQRSASLVLLTLKEAGLAVYDLKGRQLQHIAAPLQPHANAEPGRFNNVDVIYGFSLGNRKVDLALVSDRGRDRVRAYAIDPAAVAKGQSPLVDVTAMDAPRVFSGSETEVDEARTAYGLAAYSHKGNAYVAVSRRHETGLALLRLVAENGKVTYRVQDTLSLPDTFTLPTGQPWSPCADPGEKPQVEGMVVDVRKRVLYAAQEDVGVWRIDLDGNTFDDPELIDRVREYGTPGRYDPIAEECIAGPDSGFGGKHLSADAEGLTIYYGKDDAGYLLASSQGDSTFVLYDRESNGFLGSFAVTEGPLTDGAQHSDGTTITNVDLGPDFPHGLMVVHDGEARHSDGNREATNAKYLPWGKIATAFPKHLVVDPRSFNPRQP